MKRLMGTTLGCAILAGLGLANGGKDEPWTRLDRDIESLAANLTQGPSTPLEMGVLLRTSFNSSRDKIYEIDDNADGNNEDLNGFTFEDAEIWMQGSLGDVDLRIMVDGSDNYTGYPKGAPGGPPPPAQNYGQLGALGVRDAYARFNNLFGADVDVYAGQFKCPAVMSGAVGEDSLVMIDRTRIGQLFDAWQPGVAVTGDFGDLHLKLAAQNGADGAGDQLGVVARAEWRVADGAKQREGAYAAQGFDATLGAGWFEDGSEANNVEFGKAAILDAYATLDAFSFQGEILGMDKNLAAKAVGNTTGNGAQPWSTTVGFMIVPERWELAVRYQDLDNTAETTIFGGGVNYYIAGHAAKVQLNVSEYDDMNDDGLLLQLGLSVGHSQP